jgi:lipopolysaccharide export LptBFGC system permease protein LptF
MKSIDDTIDGFCSTPQRDRRNQRRVVLWSAAWAFSFLAITFGVKREWLTAEWTVAAVFGAALFGIATLLAYHQFLIQTDELRRKIEVEALALAFGIGIIGGLSFWLLFQSGIVSGEGFVFVLVAMILTHAVGVVVGRRRYS